MGVLYTHTHVQYVTFWKKREGGEDWTRHRRYLCIGRHFEEGQQQSAIRFPSHISLGQIQLCLCVTGRTWYPPKGTTRKEKKTGEKGEDDSWIANVFSCINNYISVMASCNSNPPIFTSHQFILLHKQFNLFQRVKYRNPVFFFFFYD